MANLQDSEILAIREIQMTLNRKFAYKPRTEKTIDQIEAEALQELAEIGWLAHVDAFPLLQGEQMSITLLQRIDEKEFDHEEKAWHVQKAMERGENIYGESKSEAAPEPENL